MKKILLIDDDTDIHAIVKHVLQNDYEFKSFENLSSAHDFISNNQVDLIVLDENLPDGKGQDFISKFRQTNGNQSVHIIMLTAVSDVKDKIAAFDLGADDYMVKPFEPLELVARIKAYFRKIDSTSSTTLVINDLEFDLTFQSLKIKKDENTQEIDLTPIEFKILYLLASNLDKIYSRSEILKIVWGNSSHVFDRTVDQHISKVRKKIGPSSYTVKSSHGKGYFLAEENS